MSRYKFDGKYLKYGSKIIANVSGNNIRKGSGGSIEANIKNDNIRQGGGGSIIANLRGRDIRQGGGASKIGTMDEVDKAIEGPGGITKAALWIIYVK